MLRHDRPINRLLAPAIIIAMLLVAKPARGQEQPKVAWSGKDIAGNAIRVPGESVSLILFARAGQDHSDSAIKQAQEVLAKASPAPQMIVIVSGPTAEAQARDLRNLLPQRWPIATDPDYSASGKMQVQVWPTTVLVQTDGTQAAHLAGVPPQYASELAAYLQFAAGKISPEALKQRLEAQEVVAESAQSLARRLQMAQRLLDLGDRDLARSQIADVSKNPPADPAQKLALARLYSLLDQPKDAIDLLGQLPQDAAAAGEANLVRARALVALARWTEAKTLLNDLLKTSPATPEAHYLLGLCLQHDDDWPHAAEQFRLAFERFSVPASTSRPAAGE